MTNPSETRLTDNRLRELAEFPCKDAPMRPADITLDEFKSMARELLALREAADTIDRLTSSGEAVEVPHYSSKDAEFDRLLALGTAEASEFLTWLKANPGETLSPFAQRALAHTFGFIMDKAASPRDVEVPVEPVTQALVSDLLRECERAMKQRDEALTDPAKRGPDGRTHDTTFEHILRVHLDPTYSFYRAALPHNQGETKP